MNLYLYKLTPPRPSFLIDMTAEEAATMEQHFAYWAGLVESGQVVVYGPVDDPAGAYGIGVVEAESLDAVRAIAAEDPAVRTGLGTSDVFEMPGGVLGR